VCGPAMNGPIGLVPEASPTPEGSVGGRCCGPPGTVFTGVNSCTGISCCGATPCQLNAGGEATCP
jgi:hypothetical protein